jgi:hypothetical protein
MTDSESIGVVPAAPPLVAAGRPQNRKGICMERLIVFGILAFVGYAIYRCGKSKGSRKGYNVGRSHGRRRR